MKNVVNKLKRIGIYIRNKIVRHKKIKKPKVFMTILAKNEADIIEYQLRYHKNMGIDGFIVTDHNSSDGTREIFEKYKKIGWVKEIIDETGSDFIQSKLVDRMIKVAKNKYNADWIINADADEFWCCNGNNIKEILAKSYSNVIYADIYNVYPEDEKCFFNNDKLIVNHQNIDDEHIKKLSPYSIYAKQIHKVIHRADGYISIYDGNHSVDMKMKSTCEAKDIYICHYSLRGFEHFKRKMLNGGAVINSSKELPENTAQHWRYFYDLFVNKGADYSDEYKKSHR
ncbi:hypothetical protein AYY22_15930 [Photobacterium kishitanii]|uniref:glycosyltransferase family 2 protein n=1 Tax=Photobacterium kishitanii TaxID=318456 RepID=UPI0007EF926C|nr:glycosyltransferase family 2 protein [Photobacterium kishitanii]OBU27792.1 hypothetical protein AYY22_15930 [Photobacterium kishitanii]